MSIKIANQILKARRFADWITEHAHEGASMALKGGDIDPMTPAQIAFDAGTLTTPAWQWIADEMGEKIPSYETRALIINELRMRADTAPIEWEKLNR